jgi:CDP-diacylglycerol--glycerol-3-phosphate 3-phosphatidyltransferase
VGIYDLKPAFRRVLRPIELTLIRRRVRPDTITALGLVFAAGGALGLWLGRRGTAWLVLVPLCAFLRTASNALDGMVAGSTGSGRPIGAVFNEIADRLADILFFLPLLTIPGLSDALVAGAIAAMLITSYLALAVKAAGGPRVSVGIMGKPDRMFVLGLAALIAIGVDPGTTFTWALWVIVAGCAVTFVQRVLAARRALASVSGPC